jgi:hypothetical protein
LIPKRREQCVIFLDDGFDSPEAFEALKLAGFCVERFTTYFCDGNGKRLKSVKDPDIIQFCSDQGWLMVTTDKEMETAHRETILATQAAILATTNNNSPVAVWIKAIEKVRAKIERDFKKLGRPYFCRISRESAITGGMMKP